MASAFFSPLFFLMLIWSWEMRSSFKIWVLVGLPFLSHIIYSRYTSI